MTQIVLNCCSKVLNRCSKCPQRMYSEHQLIISDYRSLVIFPTSKKNKNRLVYEQLNDNEEILKSSRAEHGFQQDSNDS